MKKTIPLILSFLLLISMLMGCGDNSSTSSPASSTSSKSETVDHVSQTVQSKDTGEEITLGFMSWEENMAKTLEEDAITVYMEKNPGVTVEVQFVSGGDYLAKLNTLIAASSEPDVYKLNEYKTLEFGMDGLAENLTPYFDAVGVNPAEKFVPGTVAMSGDECYGVGKDAATILFFYSKPLFEKYNVTPPPASPSDAWTWDEFVDAAQKLTVDTNGNNVTDPDFDRESIASYGTVLDTSGWLLNMPLLYSNGGSFASEDGMTSALTSPETIDCFSKLYNLIEMDIAPTPAIASGIPSSSAMMLVDQLAMYWTGTWEIASLNEGGVDYGIGAMPKMKDVKNISWSAHHVVSANSPNKQEAFDFMHWFIDPFTNPLVLQQGVPSNAEFMAADPEALYDFFGEENTKVIIETLDSAIAPENVTIKNFGQIADQNFKPIMDKMWYGEASAAEALQEVEESSMDLFQGRWGK